MSDSQMKLLVSRLSRLFADSEMGTSHSRPDFDFSVFLFFLSFWQPQRFVEIESSAVIVWHKAQIALYTYGRNGTDSMNFTLRRFTVCSLIRDFVPPSSEARLRS